jgi:hypothetical protein
LCIGIFALALIIVALKHRRGHVFARRHRRATPRDCRAGAALRYSSMK